MRSLTTLLLACIVTIGAASVASADTFGPDAYGYTAVDNYPEQGSLQPELVLPFQFQDIASQQAVILGNPCAFCRLPDGSCVNIPELACTAAMGTISPPDTVDDGTATVDLTTFGAAGFPIYDDGTASRTPR